MQMLSKKAVYEEEVRKDDVNFWRTSNDADGERELQSESEYLPLKRDNVYNLWLNSIDDNDFYKQGKKPLPAGASGVAANREKQKPLPVRLKKSQVK